MDTVVTIIDKKNKKHFEEMMVESISDKADVNLGLICDGNACGVASLNFGERDIQINWLYVAKACLGNDEGGKLIDAIIDTYTRSGADMITYRVFENMTYDYLDYINMGLNEVTVVDILRNKGFIYDDYSTPVIRINAEHLVKFFEDKSLKNKECNIMCLGEISSSMKNQIEVAWRKSEELDISNMKWESYDKNLSIVLGKQKKFKVAMMVRISDDDSIWIDAFLSDNNATVVDFFNVMKTCAKAAKEMGNRDVYVHAVNEKITKLIDLVAAGNATKVGVVNTMYMC